ncbi:MAG: Rid family detoxifying hydrolase [Mariniblastus sp.]|nr:Rid family detoxifying hydrolase [Mariniblastus sp.]
MKRTAPKNQFALIGVAGFTLFCLSFAGCQPNSPADARRTKQEPEVEYLISPEMAALNLPFSEAVRVDNMLYLSGQIGTLPGTTELAEGGIQGETRQTLENIKAVLEANDSSLDRVVKVTVMLADIAEWPALNEVYVEYFPNKKPARSAFAGSGLAFNARCEIEVIATVGNGH